MPRASGAGEFVSFRGGIGLRRLQRDASSAGACEVGSCTHVHRWPTSDSFDARRRRSVAEGGLAVIQRRRLTPPRRRQSGACDAVPRSHPTPIHTRLDSHLGSQRLQEPAPLISCTHVQADRTGRTPSGVSDKRDECQTGRLVPILNTAFYRFSDSVAACAIA